MRQIVRYPHRFSYTDYLGWGDDARWEIVDGEAYAMAPAPTPRHQMIVANIAALLGDALRGKPCRLLVAPTDVKLSDHDVVQPDLLVVCEQAKIGEAVVRGAPDLAIEVTSPSTEARDRREKRSLYERFGVPEYWIVSPNGFVEVYALDEGGRYPTPTITGLDESLASRRFPELVLEVNDVFEGVPIERPLKLQPPGSGSTVP